MTAPAVFTDMIVTTRCILCGEAGEPLYHGLVDRLFGVPGAWNIDRCRSGTCGLLWLRERPVDADLGRFYLDYYTHGGDDGGDAEAVLAEPGRYRTTGWKKRVKSLLATLMPWRSAALRTDLFHLEGMAPGDLLEIGCGDGGFLHAAALAGWTVTGLDFDERAVAAARRRGVDARQGSLADHDFPDGAFDAIVMNNVIEHLPDPVAVVERCARLLRPGGRLVAITPNTGSLGHRLYGPDWRGLEVPRHLFVFSAPTLAALSRASGLPDFSVFTSMGGGDATADLLAASSDIAEQSGRDRREAAHAGLVRRERIRLLLGRPVGEWVVLVARRGAG